MLRPLRGARGVAAGAVITLAMLVGQARADVPVAGSGAPLMPTATPAPAPAPTAASSAVAPAPTASAAAPAGSSSARSSAKDDVCDDGVLAWTKTASQRSGLTIAPVSCFAGVVRLSVVGAGCDFEVTRAKAFQRTTDGAIGVSPIANVEWETAPEPMKKALAALLAALNQDPSLQIRKGDPVHGGGDSAMGGSRRNQIAVGLVGALALAGLTVAVRRRRKRTVAAP